MTSRDPHSGLPPLARHGAGFVVSGLIALTVDAAILKSLTWGFGLDPLVARLAAISCAMAAGWLSHRRLTFGVRTPARLGEFAHYAGLAWFAAAINYAVFAMILLLRPATEPVAALVGSSLVAMSVSYFGMRFHVFRRRR